MTPEIFENRLSNLELISEVEITTSAFAKEYERLMGELKQEKDPMQRYERGKRLFMLLCKQIVFNAQLVLKLQAEQGEQDRDAENDPN